MTTEHTLHMALIGSGGDGVMSTASMVLRTAARVGLYGMMTQSYGPQIRGGESAAHVTISTTPVAIVGREKDLIVAFRFADVARFTREMRATAHTAVFHGVEEGTMPELLHAAGGPKIPVSFAAILEREGLPEIAKNVLLFGMLLRAMGWDIRHGRSCVQEVFGHKSAAVIEANVRALEIGYQQMEAIKLPFTAPQPRAATTRQVVSGNEACARAAVDAGCRFYAGYPITPSSEILEEMESLLPDVGGHLIQSEDEIAALGMVVGASYGGVPAMTATSGPGLSLMTEMLGLASMAEIPLVIVNCQRAGPSTGMPSQTEQSDLWHSCYGGHGDFPRVVMAPTDVTHCYRTMFRAFYCAETFQLPVLVLSDASIAQRSEIIDPIETTDFPRGRRRLATAHPTVPYLRYHLNAAEQSFAGVNAVAVPGTPCGMHAIAGIEHTEAGTPSSDGALHQQMHQKRFRKWQALATETADWYSCAGKENAAHALIAWGSSVGVARQYVAAHPNTALFVPEILHPFPVDGLRRFLKGRQRVTVLEMNYQGQLYHTLRALGAIDPQAVSARRSGGQPFQLGELQQLIAEGAPL